MTWWAVFAPLVRALTGGRAAACSPRRSEGAFAFEADWAHLLMRLAITSNALRDIVETNSLHPHFHYRHYTRPKKGGGRREITEPDAKLKQLQQEILTRYLAREVPHPAALAYLKGHSTAHHVWAHAGAEIVITADVEDFFPRTSAGRIEDWWRTRSDSDLARLLTRLTTYRGGLPQGAPTSPALSNLVNHELDVRLTLRAEAAGAHYTRYCDDLAFSWPHGFRAPSDFEPGVRATLHEFGYALHPEKGWRAYRRRDEPEITGLILTRHGRIRLPDKLRRTMQNLARSDDPRDAQRLEGYRGYEAMVTKRPRRKLSSAPRRPQADRPQPPVPVSRPVRDSDTGEEDIPF